MHVAWNPRRRRKRQHPEQMTLADVVVGFRRAAPDSGEVRALAGVVVLDEQGRLLLLHRTDPTQWELPGGKVERGEQSEHAAWRELREELGLDASGLEEVGQARFRQHDQGWSYSWFLAQSVLGRPFVAEPERFDRLQYWRMAELTERVAELSPNLRELVRAYFDGKVLLPARQQKAPTPPRSARST